MATVILNEYRKVSRIYTALIVDIQYSSKEYARTL